MVRPRESDFLQSHKFALSEVSPKNNIERTVFVERGKDLIGFSAIAIPEVTIDLQDVIEGTSPYTHKVMTGRTTTGDCTLTYAVLPLGGTDFYSWINRAAYGIGVPRRNFLVKHLPNQGESPNFVSDGPARLYMLEGCLPISHKLASDLDATDDAISLEELTMHVWRIHLRLPTALPSQPNRPRDLFE